MKEQVLAQLIRQNGAYISGEAMSEALGVSRAAVWKAIDALRADGKDPFVITKYEVTHHSADIKNVMDRSIGTSTPFSTYRGGQMHHTLRYGRHGLMKVIVYGDITENEK